MTLSEDDLKNYRKALKTAHGLILPSKEACKGILRWTRNYNIGGDIWLATRKKASIWARNNMAIRRDAVQCKKEILNVGQEGSHGRIFFSIRKGSLKSGPGEPRNKRAHPKVGQE
jgi:hypothetical protein